MAFIEEKCSTTARLKPGMLVSTTESFHSAFGTPNHDLLLQCKKSHRNEKLKCMCIDMEYYVACIYKCL